MTTTTQKPVTKAEMAARVYAELTEAGTLTRKLFIDTMVSQHGMTPAGASTYYVNCKNKAAGKPVKSYYKSKSQRTPAEVMTSQLDDAAGANAQLFSIVVMSEDNEKVEIVHSFMSEEAAADRFRNLKPLTQSRCVVVKGAPQTGDAIADLERIEI